MKMKNTSVITTGGLVDLLTDTTQLSIPTGTVEVLAEVIMVVEVMAAVEVDLEAEEEDSSRNKLLYG